MVFLFQGYYFCRPVLIKGGKIPANQLIHRERVNALRTEPLDTGRVSGLVKRDASLTYRLLRVVNSPRYGLSNAVTSIHGALVLIGDDMFRRIATLVIASELKAGHPAELLMMAFVRARFCELAAETTGQDATEQYLLGILSLLPPLMDLPMATIVSSMPLGTAVQEALLGERNAARVALDMVMACERGDWEALDEVALEAGISNAKVPGLYAEALMWAEQNMPLSH